MAKGIKKGQRVRWQSQAGGTFNTKEGTVVAVCKEPSVKMSMTDKAQILRELDGISLAKAKNKARFVSVTTLLARKYKLKFSFIEGARENTHYLVEVESGEARKPLLYHPISRYLEAVE